MSELRKAAEQALSALECWQSAASFESRVGAQELGTLVAQKLRAALAEPDQSEPMRKHVEQFAAKGGWTKDSGEGAFEFVQRISYAQGVEDGRNRPSAPPRREPLTDEQIEQISDGIAVDDYAHDLVRRVEQYRGIGGRDD